VQRRGCALLCAVASFDERSAEAVRIADGASAAAAALSVFPSEPGLLRAASGLLTAVLAGQPATAHDDAVGAGVIDALLGSVRAHQELQQQLPQSMRDPRQLEPAFAVLLELARCGGAERSATIAGVGGVASVVEALTAASGGDGVETLPCALELLVLLAQGGARQQAVEAGALDVWLS